MSTTPRVERRAPDEADGDGCTVAALSPRRQGDGLHGPHHRHRPRVRALSALRISDTCIFIRFLYSRWSQCLDKPRRLLDTCMFDQC